MPGLLAGSVLCGGRYVVVREINRGGAAVVYEAVDRELHNNVALKCVIMDVRTRDAQVRGYASPISTRPGTLCLSSSPSPVLYCNYETQIRQITRERVEREIKNASVIQHDNVVRLLNVFAEGNCLAIVLELVRGCDLLELINSHGGLLTEQMARHYFMQLVSGVECVIDRYSTPLTK